MVIAAYIKGVIEIAYEAYITRLKNVEKHSNADRLQKAQCFGNQVIVDLSYKEGDLGVYFPSDGKLGQEFAEVNNLLRKKDQNGNNVGGFIDPVKRNIKAIKLRGEKSDGLFLKLDSLSKFTDISTLKEGDAITVLNGTLICEKYVPKRNARSGGNTPKQKKVNKIKYPWFAEHEDTKQLMYYLRNIHPGDICTLTLKLHGTSARTANTVREEKRKQNFWQRIWHKKTEPIRSWGAVSGSRRVTLDFENQEVANDGWYSNNDFRKKWHDFIAPKLHKGEEVFYEIVGYVDENTLIMPQGNNKKVGDAEFVKQYGDTTEFTYGCKPGENEAYVYRMTKTDEDGYVVEYPDWYMRVRAEQMGLKVVPKFEDFIYTTEKTMLKRVEKYVDGPDPIGKTHVREGVVLRVQNRNKFEAYKNKNFSFKCIEGIIKDSAAVPDMEEAQEEAAQ